MNLRELTRSQLFLLWLIWSVLIVFVGGNTILFFVRIREGARTNHWTETSGIVKAFRREQVSGETYNQILVEYAYKVGQKEFIGKRISYQVFANFPLNTDNPEQLRNRRVPVFYDAANPSRAVLERGIGIGNFFFLAMCLVLSCVLLFVAVIAIRVLKGLQSAENLIIVED